MVDRVKPLKIEHSSLGGSQDDMIPVEANPSQDYIAVKGVALENQDTTLVHLIGGEVGFLDPGVGARTLKDLIKISILVGQ